VGGPDSEFCPAAARVVVGKTVSTEASECAEKQAVGTNKKRCAQRPRALVTQADA